MRPLDDVFGRADRGGADGEEELWFSEGGKFGSSSLQLLLRFLVFLASWRMSHGKGLRPSACV